MPDKKCLIKNPEFWTFYIDLDYIGRKWRKCLRFEFYTEIKGKLWRKSLRLQAQCLIYGSPAMGHLSYKKVSSIPCNSGLGIRFGTGRSKFDPRQGTVLTWPVGEPSASKINGYRLSSCHSLAYRRRTGGYSETEVSNWLAFSIGVIT